MSASTQSVAVAQLFRAGRRRHARRLQLEALSQSRAAELASQLSGVPVTRPQVRALERHPVITAPADAARALARLYRIPWRVVLETAGLLEQGDLVQ